MKAQDLIIYLNHLLEEIEDLKICEKYVPMDMFRNLIFQLQHLDYYRENFDEIESRLTLIHNALMFIVSHGGQHIQLYDDALITHRLNIEQNLNDIMRLNQAIPIETNIGNMRQRSQNFVSYVESVESVESSFPLMSIIQNQLRTPENNIRNQNIIHPELEIMPENETNHAPVQIIGKLEENTVRDIPIKFSSCCVIS